MVTVAVVKCIYENHLHLPAAWQPPGFAGDYTWNPLQPLEVGGSVKTFYFTNICSLCKCKLLCGTTEFPWSLLLLTVLTNTPHYEAVRLGHHLTPADHASCHRYIQLGNDHRSPPLVTQSSQDPSFLNKVTTSGFGKPRLQGTVARTRVY